jgi:hypothetical protein
VTYTCCGTYTVPGALSLLPEWIRWNGEQAGLVPDLISDAVAIAERRPEDADKP